MPFLETSFRRCVRRALRPPAPAVSMPGSGSASAGAEGAGTLAATTGRRERLPGRALWGLAPLRGRRHRRPAHMPLPAARAQRA
eukprot:4999041-Alexandrium_andersonii.AAC.1